MNATQNQELVDIFNRVKDWPLDMRITLARRILETAETLPIAEPPRTLSLDQVIGILKTDAPPPTDEECQRIIEEERIKEIRMTRILLDTNVVLDALLELAPWVGEAKTIWGAHLGYRIAAHITATSLSDIFYLSRRLVDRPRAWLAVGTCLDQLYILPVGLPVLQAAARIGDGDFEDHLQIASAVAANLDAIVTRDGSGFRNSPISVLTPAQLLAQLSPMAPGNV